MKVLLPDARFRSPTAVEGKAAMRDENLYSAFVAQDGGAAAVSIFTVPRGQNIPVMQGAGAAAVAAHQLRYSPLTTNFSKAGELGSGIGDAALRGIGMNIETAWYTVAGVQNTFGAGDREVNEILSKISMELKVGGKKQIEGPVFAFPASGGLYGGISTTGNNVTVATVQNGWPGALRRVKIPIPVARNDTLEAIITPASPLSFTTAAAAGGNPSLVWINCHAIIKGDAR